MCCQSVFVSCIYTDEEIMEYAAYRKFLFQSDLAGFEFVEKCQGFSVMQTVRMRVNVCLVRF